MKQIWNKKICVCSTDLGCSGSLLWHGGKGCEKYYFVKKSFVLQQQCKPAAGPNMLFYARFFNKHLDTCLASKHLHSGVLDWPYRFCRAYYQCIYGSFTAFWSFCRYSKVLFVLNLKVILTHENNTLSFSKIMLEIYT